MATTVVKGDLSLGLLDLQALEQGADIGNGHLAAAAAALDVFLTGLAQQDHPLLRRKGEHLIFILQQNDALSRGLAGKLNVLPAAGDHCAAHAEPLAGLV